MPSYLLLRRTWVGLTIMYITTIQSIFNEKYEVQVKYGVKSPKFVWDPCAQLNSLAETPQPPPPPTPRVWGQLLVSQDRRHLFVIPLCIIYFSCRCCRRSCLSAITFLILSKSGSEFETFCRIWIRHFPCLGSGSGFAYSFMKELSRTHLGPVRFKWPDPPLAQNEIQSPNL